MKMKILVVEILEYQIHQLKRVGEVNDFTNANCDIEVDSNNDDSQEGERHSVTCQCASATILVLESAITPDKPSYENLRELLDAINPSNTTELNAPMSVVSTTLID